MTTPFQRTRIATAVAGIALALTAGQAFGAAFALQETSGSGLGNAFAGGAAAAEDASGMWANAAAMSKMTRNQIVGAVDLVNFSAKFNNNGSLPALNQPLSTPPGNNGGDAGSLNAVPSVYAVFPINPQWAFGVGVNVPFGLITEYSDGWVGRYQALKSDVKTLNVNPAVSWKITDNVAIGVGVDYQHVKATFSENVNYSAGIAQAATTAASGGLIPSSLVPSIIAVTPGLDSFANITGDDYAWGWNAGILIDFDKNLRVGAQYRSGFSYSISGTVNIQNPALPTTIPPALAPVVAGLAANVNAALFSGGVTADIKFPSISNASVFYRLDDKWDLMGDLQYTHWSVIKNLTFVRTTGAVLQSSPENFRNTWRFSIGTNYHYDDQWTIRAGYAYDQTPVNSTDLTPRLPDNNRNWLTIGAQYKWNRDLAIDAGFAYIWISDPQINQNAGSIASYGLIKGSYSANVQIYGVQLTYSF
jgi:long-chain fatty acid transport protein